MTATAARISAYSAIVWPRTNPSAFTKYFLTKSISLSHLDQLSSFGRLRWSLDRRGLETPAGLEVCPMLELELAIHGGQQRGDGRAHLLVGNEHNYRDRRHDQRVLSHGLAVLALGHLHKQFRQLVHFPCPSGPFELIDQLRPGVQLLPSHSKHYKV